MSKHPGEADIAIGETWTALCDDDRALLAYERAEELQPSLRRAWVGIARTKLLQHDFDGARLEIQTMHESDDLGDGPRMAAEIEFFARDFQSAAKLYTKLCTHEPNGGGRFHGALDYQAALGRSFQELGRSAEAEEKLMGCLRRESSAVERQPNNPEALYRLAGAESSLGRTASSLQHLRAAVNNGWIDYRSLQLDPRFDSLRRESGFDEVVTDISKRVAEKREIAEAITSAVTAK
jgi:tetratricopeptide (TPR) repeat protein